MKDTQAQNAELLTLASADARLVLAPALGGSVVAWSVGDTPVMRHSPPDAVEPLALACFPLVPFSNRIGLGRFDWLGSAHRLPVGVGDARRSGPAESRLQPGLAAPQA